MCPHSILPLWTPLQGTYIGMYGHTMWDVACVQPRDHRPLDNINNNHHHYPATSDSSSDYPPAPPPPMTTTKTSTTTQRGWRDRDLFVDREERDYRASREQDERHRRSGGDGDLGGGRGGKVHHGAYWNTPSVQSPSQTSSASAVAAASSMMQQQSQTQSHGLGTGPGRGLFQDLRITPRATRCIPTHLLYQSNTHIHPRNHYNTTHPQYQCNVISSVLSIQHLAIKQFFIIHLLITQLSSYILSTLSLPSSSVLRRHCLSRRILSYSLITQPARGPQVPQGRGSQREGGHRSKPSHALLPPLSQLTCISSHVSCVPFHFLVTTRRWSTRSRPSWRARLPLRRKTTFYGPACTGSLLRMLLMRPRQKEATRQVHVGTNTEIAPQTAKITNILMGG